MSEKAAFPCKKYLTKVEFRPCDSILPSLDPPVMLSARPSYGLHAQFSYGLRVQSNGVEGDLGNTVVTIVFASGILFDAGSRVCSAPTHGRMHHGHSWTASSSSLFEGFVG